MTLQSSLFAATLGLLIVAAFYMPRRRSERRFLLPLALASYAIKALLVPLYAWLLVAVDLGGFAYIDAARYHNAAAEMAVELARGLPHLSIGWTFKDPGYNYFCSVLYLIFGPNTLVPRFINAAISSLTLLYVFRIARITFDERVARTASLLTALLPFTILITINQRKDAVVQFLAVFLFYHAVRLLRSRRWDLTVVPWMLGGLVLMYYLRSGFILPFLGVLVMSFGLSHRSLLQGGVLAVLTLLGVTAVQWLAPPESQLQIADQWQRFESVLQRSAESSEIGGLLRFVRITSLLEVYKLPLAAVLLVILPYPPRFNLGYLPATIQSWANLPLVLLFPFLLFGVMECLRREYWRARISLLVFPGVFLGILGATYVGVVRYRETVLPILLILVAAGLFRRGTLLWSTVMYIALIGLAAFVYTSRFLAQT